MTRSQALIWRVALLAAVLLFHQVDAGASNRYDPKLRFQTISTPRFDIHFHQGEESQARRLAALAEAVAADLDETLGRPSGRVQVILVDQTDLSNGWATPIPFNTIEIAAAAPESLSLIGNTDDWLRLVFTHEYAHIVHLSRGQGWIGGLRRVFGRMPLLYPNLFLPLWQIEGLAVHEESLATGQGRVPDENFRAIVLNAARAEAFDGLDRASGGLVDWPGGNAPYAYGAYFHEFLVKRYGEASLRQLTDETAGRVPYLGARAFKKVFNRSLGDLWREFEANARTAAVPPSLTRVTRLTEHGFGVGGPRFGPDGRLYYSVANPHGFPALLVRDLSAAASHHLVDRYLGTALGFAGKEIVFDQVEIQSQVGLQADLYAAAVDDHRVRRLTHGARAGDPDVSPDGRTIVCTIQRADRRELATLDLTSSSAQPVTLISEPGVHFAAPRWSPDGRTIAVERVSLGARAEIVLVDAVAARVSAIAASFSGARSVSPSWLADGRLLFASDRDGSGFRIYVTDVSSHATSRLEDTGANVASPAPSSDGRTLVYVGYTIDGYDLFSVPLADARWTIVDPGRLAPPAGDPAVREGAAPSAAPSQRYSPLNTIAPRFWTPTIESDEGEFAGGAAVGGTDALGRHAYAIEAAWTTSRGRPDWQVAYAYDRWRPTLFTNFSDDTDPFRDGVVRTREMNAGVLVPFRRVRWMQSLLGAFHSSVDDLSCSDCGTNGDARISRRSLRGGWLLNASRTYGYSISREEGWAVRLTTEVTREALGADGNSQSSVADVRGYLKMWPRHAVIAGRAAAARSWGDRETRRLFSASGGGPQEIGYNFGSDAVGLLRGVDESDVIGDHAVVANLDYRFPLLRIDRGLGTLPAFARVIHGAVFVDAGDAWRGKFTRNDVLVSAGAELSLDAVVGYVVPLTFTGGAAWVSQDRGWSVFARIGRAF
jgi:Tol biopolymer transport system component